LDPTIRLRLATRIHFALRRSYGEDVEVSTLLRGSPEAREVLWVCEASGDAELVALARQFAEATAAANVPVVPVVPVVLVAPVSQALTPQAAPQDTVWSQDTSGFGLTRPPALGEVNSEASAPSGWLRPMNWLRGSSSRNPG
jgi:hypothetical protein